MTTGRPSHTPNAQPGSLCPVEIATGAQHSKAEQRGRPAAAAGAVVPQGGGRCSAAGRLPLGFGGVRLVHLDFGASPWCRLDAANRGQRMRTRPGAIRCCSQGIESQSIESRMKRGMRSEAHGALSPKKQEGAIVKEGMCTGDKRADGWAKDGKGQRAREEEKPSTVASGEEDGGRGGGGGFETTGSRREGLRQRQDTGGRGHEGQYERGRGRVREGGREGERERECVCVCVCVCV